MATQSDISRQSIIGLGQRLCQYRKRRGLTRTQFSESLEISAVALRSMETGRAGVSIGQWAEVLRRLKRLGDLDMLLSDQSNKAVFGHQAHQRCMRQRASRPRL